MFELKTHDVDQLSATETNELIRELQPLFLQFSPQGQKTDSILQKISNGSKPKVISCYEGGEMCGFLNYYESIVSGHLVSHLDGVIVDVTKRSKGILGRLLDGCFNETDICYVTLLTQNPRVYTAVANRVSCIFPDIDTGLHNTSSVELAILSEKTGNVLSARDLPVKKGMYQHLKPVPDKTVQDKNTMQFFRQNLGQYDAFAVLARH